jgi:hypothetical protein
MAVTLDRPAEKYPLLYGPQRTENVTNAQNFLIPQTQRCGDTPSFIAESEVACQRA